MARDFKSSSSRRRGGGGGGGFFIGLGLGLVVAAGVYVYDRLAAHQKTEKPTPTTTSRTAARDEEATEDKDSKFDFYDMLPKFEVVVPEKKEKAIGPEGGTAPIERPGTYVLQAGSYRNLPDADRVRAQLALQGIEATIQKVTVDNDTWHRVRIGPVTNLAELNKLRKRLAEAEVDAIVVRVGD
jgi:cell division protein FtsN